MDGTKEKLLDKLITVIGEEALLFEKFLALLEVQQKALINSKAEELATVTSQLQEVVTRSKELEAERIRAVEDIRLYGGAEEDLNVAKICDMADTQRSVQLKHLRETILGLYSQIEETRMRNGLLVEQSTEQIRHTLEVIGRVPTNKDVYQRKGGISRQYAPLGVNRRV